MIIKKLEIFFKYYGGQLKFTSYMRRCVTYQPDNELRVPILLYRVVPIGYTNYRGQCSLSKPITYIIQHENTTII